MASLVVADQYYVYENRLASFLEPQPVAKRRASNASSQTPKTLTWPHKFIPPFELAKAGFYFDPHSSNPDNVTCFLCHKQMDGWEAEDNPIEEHLKHSPTCGWAVTAAVEAEYDGLEQADPRETRLLEARKATFAGRWPYESKKGWKCKTKQLAEAGWIYTPTNESDDNTTCAYCQLALDGWEASDKPIDEHYKRSPDCQFFEFINSRPPPKKTRAKATRGSKVSRASSQSAATAVSDLTAITDIPADYDDSAMTTASVMTHNSRKTARTKKASATSKVRKPRAKKEESVEIHEDVEPEDEEMPPPPPPKPVRGRKRGSDSIQDSAIANPEAPAPKKRSTRVRGSQNPDASVLTTASQDVEMNEGVARAKATNGRKRAANAISTNRGRARKASAVSVASTASTASLRRAQVPADDELDRQLQEDLNRPLTEDEDLAADSESERRKGPAVTSKTKGKTIAAKKAPTATAAQEKPMATDYEMFDPSPVQLDEAAVEADLQALDTEMSRVQESKDLAVPKKGRKPGVRKVSKQTKKTKESTPEPVAEVAMELDPEDQPQPAKYDPDVDELSPSAQLNAEVDVFHDASEVHDSSTATIVKNEETAKRGRGRPRKSALSRLSTSSQRSRPSIKAGPLPLSDQKAMTSSTVNTGLTRDPEANKTPDPVMKSATEAQVSQSPQVQDQPSLTSAGRSATHKQPSLPPPATPSAKQAVLSPSQSPQSSDAENQPPSSRPAAGAISKRVVLAPAANSAQTSLDALVSTPVRSTSPIKKRDGGNPRLIGGLQSATPWTAVDVDLIFANHDALLGADDDNLDREATSSRHVQRFLSQGGDLTSPESRMTVEEWIYHNAGRAEQKLKHECEALVSSFEKEGTRAMRVLEELVVE